MLATSPTQLPVPAFKQPSLQDPQLALWSYHGTPDSQDWLGDTLQRVRACSPAATLQDFERYVDEPLGAPLGDFAERSERVARVTGLLVNESDPEQPSLEGLVMAHGQLWAEWVELLEGHFLVLHLEAPSAAGWGGGKGQLSQEQVKIQIFKQYALQLTSLLEGVAGVEDADGVMIELEGHWDASLEKLSSRLKKVALTEWFKLKGIPVA